ncbi:carboxylesterase/lipase family protein [Sphingomonas nostoxanthinifaciens]|uniref:carboxylesterase/lipase family protein n=1 Tax=Sphingomonas nostoxanthinifaciens TaxID=2872652 RepID=UPI001CC20E21|nr:carboxylesterase family protein [Sphingomonas nostoxanthinifaciens]UAK23601.1 carboxylesterase family protein [Sphingomonas nostoxanthinifaciens]
MTYRLMLCTAAALATPALAASSGPEVKTGSGTVRGQSADGVTSFLGIPFAAAPVGALRWQPPRPAPRWQGVRDAQAYAADCMQKPFPSDAAPLGTTPAEDCLYLNVWKPASAGRGPLPVLVWIYGGGFVNGGSSPPTYSGAALARQGIVVVSFNYRVGRFGTFRHPALTGEGASGNFGFMDQVAALRWVRANVAAFGGDPAKVTIVGESAGGMSVHMLLTSPQAQGLFASAVIQSGGDGHGMPTADAAHAEAASIAFARAHGVDGNDAAAAARLRALPAEEVVDGLNLATMRPAGPPTFASPYADGIVSVDAANAYAAGRFAHVPVMVGATSNDIGGATGWMVQGARSVAATLAGAGVPVYYYRFGYVANARRAEDNQGAPHASDIPYFFDTAAIKYGDATTADDRRTSSTVSSYLVAFVKNGDPSSNGLPAWPRYSAAQPVMMTFAPDASAKAGVETPPTP